MFSRQLEVPWHSPTVAKALQDSASVRMVPGMRGELPAPETESARRRNQRNHRRVAHLLQSQDRTLRKNLRLRQSQLMERDLPRRHQNTVLKPETTPSHQTNSTTDRDGRVSVPNESRISSDDDNVPPSDAPSVAEVSAREHL